MELDTEATARIPSPTSSDSDSDSYNTESARIYFGPFKTPERKFVASSKSLFPPPPSDSPLRRSPRLSSPRPPSVPPTELAATHEDLEDIEQVVQLVNESEDEEDSIPNSGVGTPQNGEVMVDEPSSALADRVMHALDNPSPPPSPPAALSLFDPYHTTFPEVSTDYQADLMSLKITDTADDIEENPLLVNHIPSPNSTSTLIPVSPPSSSLGSANNGAQEVLINFDSFSTPPSKSPSDIIQSQHVAPSVGSKILSVDDLLLQSPAFNGSGDYPPQLSIPAVVVQSSEDGIDVGSPMAVDDVPPPQEQESVSLPLDPDLQEQEERNQVPLSPVEPEHDDNAAASGLLTTPLRRSTRPRRSVTPNPPSVPPPLVSPPSIARTQVKRRTTAVEADDEVVSDSQDESELRKSPSRSTPTAVRVRQRSPTKVVPSFQREVGSLSPTSSNLLSGLAFGAPDESSAMAVDVQETQPSQPMFSFSVFAPPETAGPSTPVRNSGPIRFASPSKRETSPQKYRIRTPAPNDPTNTPARRIPIAEAIVQGRVSPEKAVQLGYKPNGTPVPSVSTPARRVLLTDVSAPSTSKLNSSRLGSPTRMLGSKREGSSEPAQRLGQSTKGKEKAAETVKKTPTVVSKLPFPLVASEASSSEKTQEPPQPAKSSPVKSSLKQPTSRIPRIGAKPYARSADNKSTSKPPSTSRLVDLTKLPPKPSIAETARRSMRIPDVTKIGPPAASSRIKTTTATTSMTMLKRKREAEKASPAKPRVIMLRQVPSVSVTAVEPPANVQSPVPVPSALPTTKKPTGPVRIRKVMDLVPPVPRPVTPLEIAPSTPESRPPALKPPTIGEDVAVTKEASPPGLIEFDDKVPGSPMNEEPLQTVPPPAEQQDSAEIPTVVVVSTPTVTVTDFSSADDASTFGLRRTTRSRRNLSTVTDVFSEGSSRPTTSRRKPSSFRSDDIFGGMSMTALKDLTTSNTVHNQKYLAARLETEVIRKQGIRPESPAVKVRTIIQRQQDEKDLQRTERARRRSRRSDEMASSDVEGSSDVGYSSPLEDQESGQGEELPKHQRGAGDEEDYVTPERHYRGLKRTRLFEDTEMQDVEPPKRVKWDRGLFTTAYIDEVQLGSRQTLKENRTKGILAPTAKALRLDTLGNLPYADVPLTDLVPENITVKKIVYDSDVAAAEVVAIKNTRSKKKK